MAAIDPTTGVIQKTIFVGSQPNRLALSSDGTQLFVGLDGAGAVRQVDLTKDTAGVQFSLGGGPGVYNPPYTAAGLAAVPGAPNAVAVYATNGVVTIFDSGVARAKTSSGLSTYFVSNVGSLAFGSSASTLYVMSNAIGGYLYQLTVDSTGITASTQIGTGTGGNTLQYDNGRLYLPIGVVFSATTGAQLGQFSTSNSNSSSPTPAQGPVVSDSALNRAWILVPNNFGASTDNLLAFDETTFNPVGAIPVTGLGTFGSGSSSNPADLIRWGQNGLAFHSANQLYILQGPIVKDTSPGSPADVAVSVQAPATFDHRLVSHVQHPSAEHGTQAGTGHQPDIYPARIRDLQQRADHAGLMQRLGRILLRPGKPCQWQFRNRDRRGYAYLGGFTRIDGVRVHGQLRPGLDQQPGFRRHHGHRFGLQPRSDRDPTGSEHGAGRLRIPRCHPGRPGFQLRIHRLLERPGPSHHPVNTGQLTANVDALLIKQLGWAQISVTTPAPGGGTSAAVPFTIYQLLNVPANAISFDPFTQKLYAVLPSLSPTLTGNSIVAIDPAAGSVGAPVAVGSEPNLISETSDGNYLWIGLSGAKSLGRFNLVNQSPDLTVPIPTNGSYTTGTAAAMAIAAVPGSDSSLAVEIDSFDGIGILDVTGSTGTFRTKNGLRLLGGATPPVFADATHFYAYDGYTSGAEFYRYTVDANGAELTDGTTLLGMGGFGGKLAVDGGLVYGSGGGIVNPSTTPPSQVAELPLGATPFGTSATGASVIPYAAEAKSFNVVMGLPGVSADYVARFYTQHFTLEISSLFPPTRPTARSRAPAGPGRFGLPHPHRHLNEHHDQSDLPHPRSLRPSRGSIQQYRRRPPAPTIAPSRSAAATWLSPSPVAGSFPAPQCSGTIRRILPPGWMVHISTVAIPAADVQAAGSVPVTGENPGSTASNSVSITVKFPP